MDEKFVEPPPFDLQVRLPSDNKCIPSHFFSTHQNAFVFSQMTPKKEKKKGKKQKKKKEKEMGFPLLFYPSHDIGIA